MQQPNDSYQEPSWREQHAAMGNWIAFLARTLETSVIVFTRRDFGLRFFGMQAAAVLPLLFVYPVFWEGHDPRPVWAFLGLYLLFVMMARVGSVWRAARGHVQHSYYAGTPSFLRWPVFRRLSEEKARSVVEPLMVFGAGIGLMPYSEALGSYLMLATLGLMISSGITTSYRRQRMLDLRDAYLEQQDLSGRFRSGDWR